MIKVVRKDNESAEKLIKRFKKKFEKSGIVKLLKDRRYFEKPSVKKRNKKKKIKSRIKFLKKGNI